MELENSKKWYNNTGLVILFIIVFFPVGLYALWKNENISKNWKIVISSGIVFLLIVGIGSDGQIEEPFDLKKEKQDQLRKIAFYSEENLKNSLKDPNSYENVSKDFYFMNDTVYKIEIVYSATNSFGGRLQNKFLKTGVLKFNPKDTSFTNTVKFEKSF